MGAILGGTMRSPFTGVIFALELTHDVNMLLPLLVAVSIAHAFTVLALKRSILTEKVARRGYHLSREYAIDPLEILFAREVMRGGRGGLAARRAARTPRRARHGSMPLGGPQRLYPSSPTASTLAGVVTRFDLRAAGGARQPRSDGADRVDPCVRRRPWPTLTSRCGQSCTGWRRPA